MVSDAKKKRDAAKKAKAGSKAGSTKESPAVSTSAVSAGSICSDSVSRLLWHLCCESAKHHQSGCGATELHMARGSAYDWGFCRGVTPSVGFQAAASDAVPRQKAW